MPDDIAWLELLSAKIDAQTAHLNLYEPRYDGRYILQMVLNEYTEVYGASALTVPGLNLLDGLVAGQIVPPRTGAAAIGIDALVDRIIIEGFTPAQGVGDAGKAYVNAAKQLWDDNDLDTQHPVALREKFIAGRSFALVWPGTDNRAVVSFETADQVAVHRESGPPYDVDAALKLSTDEWTGRRVAMLWLPQSRGGRVTFEWRDHARIYARGEGLEDVTTNWYEVDRQDNPFGEVVPVVELADWRRLRAEPTSSIEPVASLVDTADLCEALKVFAGHFGAVPIRWATGLPVPRDLAKDPSGATPLLGPNGRPLTGFNPRADHLWTSTSKDTEFGQMTPATLEGFVKWSDDTANKIRAKTSVPEFYYGTAIGSHTTGEALKTAEAPMVRRIGGCCTHATHEVRRINSLALYLDTNLPSMGTERPFKLADPRANSVLPRWQNPETRIESQATDAFAKQVEAGVPLAIAMRETLGWAPDVVEEALELVASDQKKAAALLAGANAASGAGGAPTRAVPVGASA